MAGEPVVSVDNCDFPLSNAFLCQAITQTAMLRIRVLGQSNNVEVPGDAAFFATGNNLTIVGDLTRRTLLSSLDPACERPELRQFSSNPIATVHKNGPKYLVAALTILRAFIITDRSSLPTPIGSFEVWSNWVRGSLLWLGEADPCDSMMRARSSDRKLAALIAIIDQWALVIGEERVLARSVAEKASEAADISAEVSGSRYPDFREALLTVAGDRGEISTRRLGNWLHTVQGRIIEGRRLVQDGTRAGTVLWRLELVEQ
jgi:hypothetical protein